MAQFRFPLISTAAIRASQGGDFMYEIMTQPAGKDFIVYGPPGSGKSTIGMHRLMTIANDVQGKVALITFGNLLSNYMSSSLTNGDQYVKSFWQWIPCKGKRGFDLDGSEYLEEFSQLAKNNGGKYDCVIIDEGQDLQPGVYEAIKAVSKSVVVLCDDAQQLYEKGTRRESISSLLGDPSEYPLTINRRNPRVLYEFALNLAPKGVSAGSMRLLKQAEDSVNIMQYADEDDELSGISEILDDYSRSNVAILVDKQEDVDRMHEHLLEMNIPHCHYHNRAKEGMSQGFVSPVITTFKSTKGLEFDVVIIPECNFTEFKDENVANKLFVACTRAKEKLFITHHGGGSFLKMLKSFDPSTYRYIDHRGEDSDASNAF